MEDGKRYDLRDLDIHISGLPAIPDPWTTHHNRPRCRAGQDVIGNLIDLEESVHAAYHILFGHRTFREARCLLKRAVRIHVMTYGSPYRRHLWYGRTLARIGHLNNLVRISAHVPNRSYRAFLILFPDCWEDGKPDYQAARGRLQSEYIAKLDGPPPWMNGNLVRNMELVGCENPTDYVAVWTN